MKELTTEDLKVLYDFLGDINYYEMMAILCKKYSQEELEAKHKELFHTIIKIGRIIDPI